MKFKLPIKFIKENINIVILISGVLVLSVISSLFLKDIKKTIVFDGTVTSSGVSNTSVPICDHEFLPATCTEPRICEICDENVGTPLGHNWENATCKAPKTCKACKETEGEKSDHRYTNGYCDFCSMKDPEFGELEHHTWRVLKGNALISISFKNNSISQAKVKNYNKMTAEEKGEMSTEGNMENIYTIGKNRWVAIDGKSIEISYKATKGKIVIEILNGKKPKYIELKKSGETKLKVTKCTLKSGWKLSTGDILEAEV